jgi:Homeodomain-like domain
LVTAKQIAEKRYVVKLSDEERERLNTLIRAGQHPARQLTKARLVLKADASETGEGWRDCEIAAALDTSVDSVARTRRQLVEEGFDAVLVRKHSPASARPRIFDGAAEAKLIALAGSKPPNGRKRWTLQLLEEPVVELKIVDRASDNTIGRTPKKPSPAASAKAMGHPTGGQRRVRSRHGGWAGGLPATARSRMSSGLPGRDGAATHCGNAAANRGEARAACAARLPV